MRVLIVSPHFPPSNAADMQRVRLVLPYFREFGIEAEVLAVDAEGVASPQDPWLVDGLPKDVPIHRVKPLSLRWSKIPGLGTLSLRAMSVLRKAGHVLLREKTYDLIYFSTTQFTTQLLGPEWKKNFGVPFLLDYQDPWVSDYYRDHPEIVPPGGRLKYRLAHFFNSRNEPRAYRTCSGLTSVSPAYPKQLADRYPEAPVPPSLVIPFPGDTRDLERAREAAVGQSVFDPNDGQTHWVYIGRGGGDMAVAIRALFAALAEVPRPEKLRLHFIGTSYAAAGAGLKTIEPLAAEFGLEDVVTEHPDRIPYSQTLRCLQDADALVVPGSDDPAYTASKIYPYLLADRPMLAIFHEKSSVTSLVRDVGGGTIVPFTADDSLDELKTRIQALAFGHTSENQADRPVSLPQIPLDLEKFKPYDARSQAEKLATFFRSCLEE